MSTCWKCGKAVPEGNTECDYGCGTRDISDTEIAEVLKRQSRNTVIIDWEKVKTVEDCRTVFQAMFGVVIYFPVGIPDSIKPFLSDKPQEEK